MSYGRSESDSYHFDRSGIREEGDRKRVWRLFALREPQADVQSGKALIEFQCRAGTWAAPESSRPSRSRPAP